MATIHLHRHIGFGNKLQSFWSIKGVENVQPEERGLLGLELQEYNIIAGDISIDPANKLQKYLDDWKKHGHVLIFGDDT
jgi:hypothetical protein